VGAHSTSGTPINAACLAQQTPERAFPTRQSADKPDHFGARFSGFGIDGLIFGFGEMDKRT
jgi:hypothetical protein